MICRFCGRDVQKKNEAPVRGKPSRLRVILLVLVATLCVLYFTHGNGPRVSSAQGMPPEQGTGESTVKPAAQPSQSSPEIAKKWNHEEIKRAVDAAPLSLVHLDLNLAGPPFAHPVAKGTIYSLQLMQIFQKVPGGYLMQAAPSSEPFSTELAFLKTDMDLSENKEFLDISPFAVCTGTYEYVAVNGFTRSIFEFSLLSDEANGYVIERLKTH